MQSMKIAHLILCHSNPGQIERLIRRLQHPDAWFYIHVDNKAMLEPFLPLEALPNTVLVKNRVDVYWGGYSIVQATLNGFTEILASGISFSYINLMSGQDYPIKSTNDIHSFFAANPDKAFMHTLSVMQEWQEAIPRITKYHLVNFHFPGRYKVEKVINTIMPSRRFPGSLTPVGRSQWLTITSEQTAYILNYLATNKQFVNFFKLSWAPDEMIFQTILYNSPFKNNIVNNNLRYIDWSQGGASPKLLRMEDADALRASDKLFARKFNPAEDSAILDYLDKITDHK